MIPLIIGRQIEMGGRLGLPFPLPPEIVMHTMAILAKKGAGKRLALNTPIPTPRGWSEMGNLHIGDDVFDELGNICQITYISPIAFGDSFQVSFSDGSTVLADAEHQWETRSYLGRLSEYFRTRLPNPDPTWAAHRPQCQQSRRLKSVVTTAQIGENLLHNGARNHAIDNTAPLNLPTLDLPIEPYLLGAWLGDGTAANGYLTIGKGGEALTDVLQETGHDLHRVGSCHSTYRVTGFHRLLRENGMLGKKFIPPEYLRSSKEQRLSLLQGLLDTDGGWSGSQVEFSNKSEQIADGVYELVVSLGMTARKSKRIARLRGRDCGISYRIRFSPTMQVFRLPRKAERWRADTAQQQRRIRRYITGIVSIPTVAMRCISVSSPSHLYLAGRAMIPTHNSYTAGVVEEEMAKQGLPFVVLDPVGVHYGIRSDKSGKRPSGFPVVVFGGLNADVPIEERMGQAIAEAIIDENISCIVDLSELSKGAWRRFTRDFCITLYKKNKTPRHVFVEEATEFVPQTRRPEMQEAYEAVERMIRLGRNRGLGVTIIAQRSAQVAKDVLTQLDVLVVLRTVGSQDRNAILDTLRDVMEEDDLPLVNQMKKTMPSLGDGRAWIWSPTFLKCFTEVQIRERETYHGGATPTFEVGTQVIQARPDVSKLRARLETVAQDVAVSKGGTKTITLPCNHETEITELKTKLERAEGHSQRLATELNEHREDAGRFRQIRELLNVNVPIFVADGKGGVDPIFDEESVVQKVLARMPRDGGAPIQVTPPEALRKKYLEQAVDRTYEKIKGVGDKQRRAMEILLSNQVFWSITSITKAVGSGSGGQQVQNWRDALKELVTLGLVVKGGNGRGEYKANVQAFVQSELSVHSPTDTEVNAVVQHVLARLVT